MVLFLPVYFNVFILLYFHFLYTLYNKIILFYIFIALIFTIILYYKLRLHQIPTFNSNRFQLVNILV